MLGYELGILTVPSRIMIVRGERRASLCDSASHGAHAVV